MYEFSIAHDTPDRVTEYSSEEQADTNLKTRFFDSVAESWDRMCHYDERKIRFLLQKLEMQPGDSVLDVGTGTGVLIPYFRELNPQGRVVAVDNSAGMIRVARQKFGEDSRTRFLILDIEKEPVPERFKHIVLYSVFPHLEHKIQTISRLVNENLVPGGRLLIAHSDSRSRLNEMHRRKNQSVCQDMLADVRRQAGDFSGNGLNVEEAFENEELYYLLLSGK